MRVLNIEAIADSQDFRCEYCEHLMIRQKQIRGIPYPRNAMTKDHLEPRVYGGQNTRENLIAACFQCNLMRGEMDAKAFTNLMRKWFKQDPTLQIRWHTISRDEFKRMKLQTLAVHERHMRGLGRYFVEYAFRHFDFTFREGHRLRQKGL
jgi:hypothetical protein